MEIEIAKPKVRIQKKKKPTHKKLWTLIVAAGTLITLATSIYKGYVIYKTPDITGEWYLTLKVETSTYKPYIGDVIGIKAYLTQKENTISGHGEKWDYRGEPLAYNQHRKLEFDGTLNKNIFKTNYVLHGLIAETTGIIEVEVIEDGKKMIGRFRGTAADSKGTVIGEKR